MVVRRLVGFSVRIGGEQHSGWLPAGAAKPVPTPVRDVLLDLEIQYDGYGYLLCYMSQDHSVYGDSWHATLAEAEQAAAWHFGIGLERWQAV